MLWEINLISLSLLVFAIFADRMSENQRKLALSPIKDMPLDLALASCREGCGACCIAPSITTPIPGMPFGKPAGIPCVQLMPDYRCALFGRPERPKFCGSLQPSLEMCGHSTGEAMAHLDWLEIATQPPLSLLS